MSRRPVVQFDKDLPASVVAPLEADGRAVVCLIDVGAGRILAANEEGAAAFGLHATSTEPVLDAAMPALAQLRALAAAPAGRRVSETLLFWTRGGALRLPCQIQIIETGSRVVAVVVSDCTPPLMETSPPRELLAGDDAAKLREIARRIRAGQNDMGRSQRRDPNNSTVQTGQQPIVHAPLDRAPSQTKELLALRASLAHELKTPLSAIATAAEIMKAERFGPLGAERYVGYAADIYGSAQHVLGVIDRMLAEGTEGLESPEGQLDFVQIAVGDILKASVSQMAPLAERADIALNLDVPQRLPHLIADATSLRQMVFNLLTNALKFTARGGRVVLAARHSGDGPLEISITDTGCGMSPQQVERLLGRARAPRPTPRAPSKGGPAGLGLGLPLVQSLAAANGAELVLESEPGKGTSASIVFRKDRVVPV